MDSLAGSALTGPSAQTCRSWNMFQTFPEILAAQQASAAVLSQQTFSFLYFLSFILSYQFCQRSR